MNRGGLTLLHFSMYPFFDSDDSLAPASGGFSRLALLVATLCSALLAPDLVSGAGRFGELSIEELMNESVTSVSKMKQRRGDAAAAIAVLTNDDLRRSGATTLPEALRLVPGMDIASVNASEWAVSARGFNDVLSKKLLVLVDGRAVYNPITSGVFWDLQQTMLEDVDRVEVIRGPGASVWGANAVNGVINVVSRSAQDTQGGLVYGGGGDGHRLMSGARYGGKLGARTYYRVFGSVRSEDARRLADGQSAHDSWRGQHGGVRIDHLPDADTHFTWQAEATGVEWANDSITSSNIYTLGRWTRQLAETSSVEVQAYYDRVYRDSHAQAEVLPQTFDFTVQHNAGLGPRNNMVWGLGYRLARNTITQTNPFVVVPNPKVDLRLYSAFVHDEFQLVPDKLVLTAGVKLEHNDYTGFEFQPSVRVMFKPDDNQTVWSAVSRAVRTPTTAEGKNTFGAVFGAPISIGGGFYLPVTVGNAEPDAEVLWAYEAGYRAQLSKWMSADVAVFYNDYSKLIGYHAVTTLVPGTPFGFAEIPALNLLEAQSHGAEVSLVVAATGALRFTANYAFLLMHVRAPAGYALSTGERSAPRHQFLLRTSYDFSPWASLDVQLRRLEAVEGAAAYTTADVRLAWRATERVELSLVGQNLFERQHQEQGPYPFATSSDVMRGVYGKLAWRF